MTTRTLTDLWNATNLRKLAARTVETYPTEWKVVHEALQNAKDAIRTNGQPGIINIVLDVAEQSVMVTDTGRGFPRNDDLLGFGGTDKDTNSDWLINGRQGVGLKAVILSTSSFSIDSVHDGNKWSLKITDADNFITGDNPVLTITAPEDTMKPSGTTVRYTFREPLVTEFLSTILDQQLHYVTEYLANDSRDRITLALESYFRSYTYVGDLNVLLGLDTLAPADINIDVIAPSHPTGNLHDELGQVLKSGKVTCAFKSGHWSIKGAVDRTRPGRPRTSVITQAIPPAGSFGRYNDNFVYANVFTTPEEYEQLLINPNLRRRVDPDKYRTLFQQLRGIYVAIGAGPVLSRYLVSGPRQFIAANGTPTAHVLPVPTRGGDASYVSNNIHFVANVDAHLNYGKQTISNTRLLGLVTEYFSDAVRATLRNVAIAFVGSSNASSSAGDIESSSQSEMDVISRPILANGLLNFKRVPRDENALIAIFFELLGRNHLTGYHFFSLSQKARYDGRASMKLSSMQQIPVPTTDSDLQNVEFKLDIGDLIEDFESEAKFPNEIQLAIVWDDSIRTDVTDYQILNIDYTDDSEKRLGGVEKVLHCKKQQRMIQVLVLQDYVRDFVATQS